MAILVCFLLLGGTAAGASWSRLRPLLFQNPSASTPGELVEVVVPPAKVETKSDEPGLDSRLVTFIAPPREKGAEKGGEKGKAKGKPNYAREIRPLMEKYCIRCHGDTKPKAGVNLDRDKDDAAVLKHRLVWEKSADILRAGDMPPSDQPRPSPDELELLNRWFDTVVLAVDCSAPREPGKVTLRRLNRAEYNNTIRDLLGVDFQPAKDFPADDVGYGFDNIGDVLSLPPLLMEKYLAAAEQIVEKVWQNRELRQRIIPARQPGDRRRGGAEQILQPLASRAYRRPATAEEVKRLVRFVDEARRNGEGFETGIKTALTAILVSPHFLFKVEGMQGGRTDEPSVPLTEWELATRLSYFLWSSMPDNELSELAAKKMLREPGVLEGQVKRMLADPKARALAENFATQWLQIRNLDSFNPDPKQFPLFNESLRRDMRKETEEFFLHIVREDRSILEFLDSDYTFVNERLAKLYGLKGVKGENFRKVSLLGTERGGILTQASILAVTSNPTRTSPVKRGKFILESILGTPPPPPPPDVEELKEGPELKGTLRQRMEQHRANPNCAVCHQRMDALGFGFENFDAIGAFRTRDGGSLIDPSGELPGGKTFKGPAELRKVLLEKHDQFSRCLVEKLLTYALGRGIERSDRCTLDEITAQLAKKDHKFGALVIEIVKSDLFQKRSSRRN